MERVNPDDEAETVKEIVPWNPLRLVAAIGGWIFWPR
jgi:hypothetical protein